MTNDMNTYITVSYSNTGIIPAPIGNGTISIYEALYS